MVLMITKMIGGYFDDAEDIVFAEVSVHAVGLDECRRRSERGVVNHLLHSSHSSKILPGSTIMIIIIIIVMIVIITMITMIMIIMIIIVIIKSSQEHCECCPGHSLIVNH